MANVNQTNVSHRQYLREKAIKGAAQYAHYLMDKVFLVVCEDGQEYELRFFKTDYRHLTGISTNLSDEAFFSHCKSRTLDIGNIDEYQKYNWSTLKTKADRISQIHRILYDNTQNALFMINLHAKTRDFPVAIKNMNINACVGFIDNNNKARTLRKYNNSNNADEQKKIYLIIARKQSDFLYDELVYTSYVEDIYNVNKTIIDKMDAKLQNKFLEILTAPQKS